MDSINKRIRTWSQNTDSTSMTPHKRSGLFGRKGHSSKSLGKPPRTPNENDLQNSTDNDKDDAAEENVDKSAHSSSFARLRRFSWSRLSSAGSGMRKRASSLTSMRSFTSSTEEDNDNSLHTGQPPATPTSKPAFFKWTDTPRNMLRRSGGGSRGSADKLNKSSSDADGSGINNKQSFARKSGRGGSMGKHERTMNSVAHAYGAAELHDSLVRYRRVIASNNDTAIRNGTQLAEFLNCPPPLADGPFIKNIQGFTHKYLSHDPVVAASDGKKGGIDVVTALRLETLIHLRDDPLAREKCTSACLSAMGMDSDGRLSRGNLRAHMEQIRNMIEAEAKVEEENDHDAAHDVDARNKGKSMSGGRGRLDDDSSRGEGGGGGGVVTSINWMDSEWRELVSAFKDGREELTRFLNQQTSLTSVSLNNVEGQVGGLAGVDRNLQTYIRLKVFLADHAPEYLENLHLTMDKNVPNCSQLIDKFERRHNAMVPSFERALCVLLGKEADYKSIHDMVAQVFGPPTSSLPDSSSSSNHNASDITRTEKKKKNSKLEQTECERVDQLLRRTGGGNGGSDDNGLHDFLPSALLPLLTSSSTSSLPSTWDEQTIESMFAEQHSAQATSTKTYWKELVRTQSYMRCCLIRKPSRNDVGVCLSNQRFKRRYAWVRYVGGNQRIPFLVLGDNPEDVALCGSGGGGNSGNAKKEYKDQFPLNEGTWINMIHRRTHKHEYTIELWSENHDRMWLLQPSSKSMVTGGSGGGSDEDVLESGELATRWVSALRLCTQEIAVRKVIMPKSKWRQGTKSIRNAFFPGRSSSGGANSSSVKEEGDNTDKRNKRNKKSTSLPHGQSLFTMLRKHPKGKCGAEADKKSKLTKKKKKKNTGKNGENEQISVEEQRDEYRMRLICFFREYNSAKLPDVNSILIKYEGREVVLFEKLKQQYGQAVPSLEVAQDEEDARMDDELYGRSDSDSHAGDGSDGSHLGNSSSEDEYSQHEERDGKEQNEQQQWRKKLVAFYERTNPAKLKDVDMILTKYEGREDVLFAKLEKQYDN